MVFLVPLILGVGIGLGRGGRPANISTTRFRRLEVVVVSAVLTLGAAPAARSFGPLTARSLIAVSLVLLVAFLWFNRGLAGFGALCTGVVLNALVMIPNGRMPVSAHAAEALGGHVAEGVRHGVASSGSALPFLGDVLPLGPLGVVVSIGDVLMAIGIVVFLASGLRGDRAPMEPGPRSERQSLEDADGRGARDGYSAWRSSRHGSAVSPSRSVARGPTR